MQESGLELLVKEERPFAGGVIGVPSPLRLFVNHVLTLCSVIPSVSPSGPRTCAPLFMATSASLQIRARSIRWSRVGNWFWNENMSRLCMQ